MKLGAVHYLILVSILLVFIIPFNYEIPLGDDWDYHRMVGELTSTGDMGVFKYSSASLFSHIAYGASFSQALGYSFSSLHLSIMILSIVGVIGLFYLLREVGISEKYSFLGSLFLLLNPIYYNLSHTFMSDVTFVALTIFAILFFLRGIKKDHNGYLLLGSIFVILSFYTKQFGILTITAIVLYYLLYERVKLKEPTKLFILVALPAGLFLLMSLWLSSVGQAGIGDMVSLGLHRHTLGGILTLGVFFFPLSLLYLANWKKLDKRILYGSAVILIASTIFFVYKSVENPLQPTVNSGGNFGTTVTTYDFGLWRATAPFLPNTINLMGLGATSMQGEAAKVFPDAVWIIITILAFVFVWIFFSRLFVRFRGDVKKKEPKNLFYLLGLLYLVILFRSGLIDRYLLIFMPILIPLVLIDIQKLKMKQSHTTTFLVGSVILFGLWSIPQTYDYLQINQAKWDGINDLLSAGVAKEDINGGFEYGGTYLLGHAEEYLDKANRGEISNASWSQAFYYPNATYVLSFSEINGFKIERSIKYTTLFGSSEIYVLKRS